MIPIRLNFSVMLCGNAARIRLGVSMLGFIRLKIRPMESNKRHAAKDSKVKPDKDTIKMRWRCCGKGSAIYGLMG